MLTFYLAVNRTNSKFATLKIHDDEYCRRQNCANHHCLGWTDFSVLAQQNVVMLEMFLLQMQTGLKIVVYAYISKNEPTILNLLMQLNQQPVPIISGSQAQAATAFLANPMSDSAGFQQLIGAIHAAIDIPATTVCLMQKAMRKY